MLSFQDYVVISSKKLKFTIHLSIVSCSYVRRLRFHRHIFIITYYHVYKQYNRQREKVDLVELSTEPEKNATDVAVPMRNIADFQTFEGVQCI